MTNCSNNYGPYQFPEKLIPLMILNALEGETADLRRRREHPRLALRRGPLRRHPACARQGVPGGKYNIGGGNERTNLEVVDALCAALEAERPARENPALAARGLSSYTGLKTFVADRPGHDRRYAIDARRSAASSAGHRGTRSRAGCSTVRWYLGNRAWCQAVQAGKYRRERLGLAAS